MVLAQNETPRPSGKVQKFFLLEGKNLLSRLQKIQAGQEKECWGERTGAQVAGGILCSNEDAFFIHVNVHES